jgi:hypothetical protein
MSSRPLTGYDNHDALSGQPDEEVFLYDAQAKRLVCVSCNPTGARPVGMLDQLNEGARPLVDPVGVWRIKGVDNWIAGSLVPWTDRGIISGYHPHFVFDSGRVFFDSADALVPQDTNGLEDAYQYEPAGVGGCRQVGGAYSERSGGCVDLISSGTSAVESGFMDASETGDDVFFVTSAKLAPEDYDTAADMYDAHVCTPAVPCHVAPVSPPPCTSGDSCKAAPAAQPELYGAPASATFNGAGNVVGHRRVQPISTSKKCARGRLRSGDRCVKRKHRRSGKGRRAGRAAAGGRMRRKGR